MHGSRLNRDRAHEENHAFFDAYCDYARTLRTWLVAYGVGGPVLFLTQERISAAIAASGQGRTIAYLFLLGAFLQICISLINKWANWHLYAYGDNSSAKLPWLYKVSNWIIDKFYLDIICDIGSVVSFGVATMKVLLIVSLRPI